MAEAFLTPHLLTWARQRRGLEVEDLAKKLNVKPDAVNAWEAGERRPTFRQAQNFAQASYVPFGYLYLADPPVQELPLPDFHTIPGQPPSITTSVQGGMWGDARMAARRLAWERLARSLLSCVSSSHRSNSVGPNRSRGSISPTTR